MQSRTELDRVRAERDLYRRLLELGAQKEIERFLEEALAIVIGVTGAEIGYLEVHDVFAGAADDPGWYMARGVTDAEVDDLRRAVSRGIIAQAIATETTIETPAAVLDPRFSERSSIQVNRIEAVLCVPVGSDPPCGAVYLQRPEDAGPFDPEDRGLAEIFAFQLGGLASRLLEARTALPTGDPTQVYRERIHAEAVIGRSEAIASLLRDIGQVSALDVGVLLTGESGTGKSLVARVIHDNGPRRGEPFVELNCGAIPEALIESELFGAEEGAHSTARRRITGKVDAAERGTLFLDEVSELHVGAQAKLLQLLQSKTYFPLGGSELHRANIRIIAASNVDLEQAVREGRFREDLYYRLHVLPVRVPSVAERVGDVAELARHFASLASQNHGLPRFELSPSALRALEAAEWPGNVRQLEHAIEAAVVRAAGERAGRVEVRHVFPKSSASPADGAAPLTYQEATRGFQADLIARTLDETGWNVSEAARRLDLARSHVYNLIRAFGLERR